MGILNHHGENHNVQYFVYEKSSFSMFFLNKGFDKQWVIFLFSKSPIITKAIVFQFFLSSWSFIYLLNNKSRAKSHQKIQSR